MDFITQSLDLLPRPAALFDTRLRLVAANAPAWKWYVDEVPEAIDGAEGIREHSGLGPTLQTVLGHGGTEARHTEWGWLVVSALPTAPGLTRPDLILATLHDLDETTSRVDHARMTLTLNLNEAGEIVLRSIETVILQAEGVARAQRRQLDLFNDQMSAMFGENYLAKGN